MFETAFQASICPSCRVAFVNERRWWFDLCLHVLRRERLLREQNMSLMESMARVELDAFFQEHAATAPVTMPLDVRDFTAHDMSGTLMSSSSITTAIAASRQSCEEPSPKPSRSKSVPRRRTTDDVAHSKGTVLETSEERSRRLAPNENYKECKRQGVDELEADRDARLAARRRLEAAKRCAKGVAR